MSTLEKVLEAGASPNHPFYSIRCEHTRGIWQDWGPVVLAAKSGHEAVVMFLLEKGANIDPEGRVCPMNVQEDEDEDGGKHTKANPLFWSLAHGQESVTHAMKSPKVDQEFAKFMKRIYAPWSTRHQTGFSSTKMEVSKICGGLLLATGISCSVKDSSV